MRQSTHPVRPGWRRFTGASSPASCWPPRPANNWRAWYDCPRGHLLGPMLLLSVLHAGGWLTVDLPRWLLVAAYALLGWYIGLGFMREALLHPRRALPVVAGAALALMGLCAPLAWSLTYLTHVDPLTAYLATSPGGLDSVAVIAASTPGVDLPFVLTLQSVRLFVIGLAPLIKRLVVRHSPHLRPATA